MPENEPSPVFELELGEYGIRARMAVTLVLMPDADVQAPNFATRG